MNVQKFYNSANFKSGRDRCLYCDPGSPVRVEYAERINEVTHMPELFEIGKTDLVELHNADKDSCDVGQLVRRYQSGDLSALNQSAMAFYADVSQMPHDPIEAANSQAFARQMFDRLPTDVKSDFGNNYLNWLTAFMKADPKACEPFGIKFNKTVSQPEKTEGDVNNEPKQE